ncbi:MAG: DUF3108 domain-containing protein [Alphaproteobacteria bacterium]
MPILTAALVAGGLAFLPVDINTAITAIQAMGPRRLDITYEGYLPLPVIGTRIKAANASISAWIGPSAYNIVSRAEAAGIVGWFVDYNLTISSTGVIGPDGLKPTHYDSFNKDGKKNRHVLVDFGADDVVTTATPHFGDMGFPPASHEQKMESMDPLAAIVQLSLGGEATPANPCGGPIRAYDGKQRYDLKLTFAGRIAYRSEAYTGPALKCDVEYVELAGFKNKTPEQRAKDKGDVQWTNMILAELDDGAVKPPLKIEARSKARGRIGIEATKLTWRPAEPAQPVSASVRQGG